MQIGIDTYSYHRLHGVLRPGEPPPRAGERSGWREDVAEALALEVDAIALQTMFLGAPDTVDIAALREEADGLDVLMSWGGATGLAFGADPARLDELDAWLTVAGRLGVDTVRVVVGGPQLRGKEPVSDQIRHTVPLLQRAADAAGTRDIALAVENHGDLTVAELLELLNRAGDDGLGVCLDVANVLRLGEEPLAAVRACAARIRMVHLRDCEDPAAVADPVTGPRMRRYGDGVVPIGEVLHAVREGGRHGPICVELAQLGDDDECQMVADCVAWLQRWRDDAVGQLGDDVERSGL